ncbi:Protein O-mannosyltransferase 2 [Podochytrium sp. JEL0797]|nr:Protein O-mannosyltransferase 2 [Podochytrium sp. JEL0797]
MDLRKRASSRTRIPPTQESAAFYTPPHQDTQAPSISYRSATHQQRFDSEQKTLHKRTNPLATSAQVPQRANLVVLAVFTLLALFTRLYQIGRVNSVVWDEAHFGKFAGYYVTHSWYTDLHPPLGKSLLGLFARLVNYDGHFPFNGGAEYPATLHHTPFRAFCATLASFTVPLAYLTGLELHLSHDAAVFLGVMALTDIATLVLSRFILLDPLLLFTTSCAIWAVCRFRNYQAIAPFSRGWYTTLLFLGLSLGLCISIKWVGLFVVLLIGLHTLNDLLSLLHPSQWSHHRLTPNLYLKHWLARILLLILLPLSIYLLAFRIHFAVLTHSGPGDSKMGSLFQYHLVNSEIRTSPLQVAYESELQIRYHGPGGGLLHSHSHDYPAGSKEQQVTLYGFRRDDNNRFVVRDGEGNRTSGDVEDGAVVKLVHRESGKVLRVHKEFGAPMSGDVFREVSFGDEDSGGERKDLWRVEVVDELGRWWKSKGVKNLVTRFRLRSVGVGCVLRSDHLVKLEKGWGFEQQEVACDSGRVGWFNSRNSLWNVEEHWNPAVPEGKREEYPWSFYGSFMDDNYDKMLGNSMLVPEPGQAKSSIESYPWEWPMMHANLVVGGMGLSYNIIGLPLIWGGVTVSLVAYLVTAAVYVVRWFRGYNDFKTPQSLHDFWFLFKLGIVGWLVNFIPYILMPRVTYIHHYLPALQFGMPLFAFMVDHLLVRAFPRNKVARRAVVWGLIVVDVVMFLYFKDFAFGYRNGADYEGRRWLQAWKF